MRNLTRQIAGGMVTVGGPEIRPRTLGSRLRWAPMTTLIVIAACSETPTAPPAQPSSEPQRLTEAPGSGTPDCGTGWTWQDYFCVFTGDPTGGGTGGTGGTGGSESTGGTSSGGFDSYGNPPTPPLYSGWSQAEYDLLSPGEKHLLLHDDPPKWYYRKDMMWAIRDSAMKESMRITAQSNDIEDTRQNAYQHAFWAALMSLKFGYNDALAWTSAHEERPVPLGSTQEAFDRSKLMDLHNNNVGLTFYYYFGSTNLSDYLQQHEANLCWLVGAGARAWCF